MRPIVLVNSKAFEDIPTLSVNTITYLPIYESLLESNIQPFAPSESIDVMIFTSKHAVESLNRAIQEYPVLESLKEIPSFAIGAGSSSALQKSGFIVEFVGSDAHGDSFSKEIITQLKGRRPLYLRAQKIVSGLDNTLMEAKIPLKQIVAYRNSVKSLPMKDKPKPRSIVIFTAPSNYFSFLQNFGWDGSYIAIAIGMTTFSVFAPEIMGYVSPKQTIEGCVEFAKELRRIYP